MHTSKVTQKGQIVIPQDLRKKYNLRTSSPVMVTEIEGHIAVIPVVADPVKDGYGRIRLGVSVEDLFSESHREEEEFENRKLSRLDHPKKTKKRAR